MDKIINTLTRALELAKMDKEMRNLDDENYVMMWLYGGMPDGSNLVDYIEFAHDPYYTDIKEEYEHIKELIKKEG